MNFLTNCQRVVTPHIAKENLYLTSGHLPYYADSMYPPMELEGERYYLKAMNCPHHHKIFDAEPKSYRDLPYRIAEYGTCYRYEQSGELFGLMRVRCLHMNDAHIYCSKEQFKQEFQSVNEMYLKYFKIFGIEKYVMRLSLHDPAKLGEKYVNEPELWKETEEMVRNVLIETGVPYVEVKGEGAFYGPKIKQNPKVPGKNDTLIFNKNFIEVWCINRTYYPVVVNAKDKKTYASNFKHVEQESNKLYADRLLQKVGEKLLVINPPFPTMTEKETDASFDLPYTRLPPPEV